ncbi:MAG TPA: DoxX family protein [Bdellovibrionota bacterium]|nr:DoxX family protein [Bdellovibrionota bacterium]
MRGFGMFLSRSLIGAIFLISGVGKIFDPQGTLGYMQAFNMPAAGVFLVGAIIFELIGGLFFICGLKTRFAGILLLVFLIPTTIIFHTNFAERLQQIMFLKNLAIIGGILSVIIRGPGSWSLDSRNS